MSTESIIFGDKIDNTEVFKNLIDYPLFFSAFDDGKAVS